MKVRIVVDANILISALLGGQPRLILFDKKYQFITTDFTLKEVNNYIPLISKKSGVSKIEIKEAISLFPLRVLPREYYKDYLLRAKKLMQIIDPADADILALYLKENTFLWSEDKDFEKINPSIKIIKTKDFF